MFNIKGIEHLLIEDMKKVVLNDTNLNVELGDEDRKINFWKTGAYLASTRPVAFYTAGVRRDVQRELDIILNQAGWLFSHAYIHAPNYEYWKEFFNSKSSWFYFTARDGSVYTLCYLPEELWDKAWNGTLTEEEANKLIYDILDYFNQNPTDFKFTYNNLLFITGEGYFGDVSLTTYNIKSYSDYDKAEIDIYNSLQHDETIEKLYFEEVLPEIKRQIETRSYV